MPRSWTAMTVSFGHVAAFDGVAEEAALEEQRHVDEPDQHGHLDERPDHGRERRPVPDPEHAHGDGNRQLEVVRRGSKRECRRL